jgi:NitT/TauT family transport system substrate-binding protein
MFAKLVASLTVSALVLLGAAVPAAAAPKKDFKVCWSIYVGWMPWGYMTEAGIMKKWADKYGLNIEVVKINDYVESINQYTAGAFDGCAMTNMDALSIPAGGGIDTTALIVGDFSNGNDAVILKGKDKLGAIKGQKVNLVELSVSHYLLARALDSVKLAEKDIKIVNTSDADLVAAYKTKDVTAVVTWNPLVSTILEEKSAKKVFDSSQIPGEIIDLMVVNTETLKDNPDFGKALVGAWYETIALMKGKDKASIEAKTAMATASATDLAGFDSQLATTQMFYEPKDAVEFTRSAKLPQTMDYVRKFLFSHGILGQNAKSVDVVGIAFPDGKILGSKSNVKLRFDPSVMALAAEGKL